MKSAFAKPVITACLFLLPVFPGAMPLWLDSASRGNPADPKAHQFQMPSATAILSPGLPTSTATAGVPGAPSATRTPTQTGTPTQAPGSATRTPSPVPSATLTALASSTATASSSPTRTKTILTTATPSPTPHTLRVACVGDSLTLGDCTTSGHSYPAQLGLMMGSKYEVRNYGVGSTTMLKNGGWPYWNQPAFTDSSNWQPDIVIIMLGTNDSKPGDWNGAFQPQFEPNYEEMITHYQTLASGPRVFVNTCVAVQDPGNYGITDAVVTGQVVPLVRQAAAAKGCSVIEVNAATQGNTNYCDHVHLTDPGALVIAQTVHAALLAAGYLP